MMLKLILPVLLTTTNYCYNNQVIPPPGRLGWSIKPLTNLIWGAVILLVTQAAPTVLFSSSQKHGVLRTSLYLVHYELRVPWFQQPLK